MAAVKDAVTVAADVSGKVLVKAKGRPAQIVAYGAAAAVMFVAVAASYGAYLGGKELARRALPAPRRRRGRRTN